MMLSNTTRWSHPPDNQVVPSPWQATALNGLDRKSEDCNRSPSLRAWRLVVMSF